MNILIYGNGWIGSQFVDILKTKNINYIISNSRIELENIENIKKEIIEYVSKNNVTNVISFLGRTHGNIGDKYYSTIDYLEQSGKLVENIRDNMVAPILLSSICNQLNLHFTYLGTGCIFDYKDDDKNYKFTEEDIPNFFGSSYSIVKGYTDRIMKFYKNTLILRIRMPIIGDANPRNFITKITKYEKICSISNSMTVLPELLPLIISLMEDKYVGTLNFTNPGVISHNEILEMYKKYVNPDFTWNNFSLDEQDKILDSKRSNNHLDTTLLENKFPKLKNIKDSVETLMQKYKI
jgi:3,5-epimerase/4-reductase